MFNRIIANHSPQTENKSSGRSSSARSETGDKVHLKKLFSSGTSLPSPAGPPDASPGPTRDLEPENPAVDFAGGRGASLYSFNRQIGG